MIKIVPVLYIGVRIYTSDINTCSAIHRPFVLQNSADCVPTSLSSAISSFQLFLSTARCQKAESATHVASRPEETGSVRSRDISSLKVRPLKLVLQLPHSRLPTVCTRNTFVQPDQRNSQHLNNGKIVVLNTHSAMLYHCFAVNDTYSLDWPLGASSKSPTLICHDEVDYLSDVSAAAQRFGFRSMGL